EDVMSVGEKIQVEVTEIDQRGKLSLVPVEVIEKEAQNGGGDSGDGASESSGGDTGESRERRDDGERRPRRRRTRRGGDDAGQRNSGPVPVTGRAPRGVPGRTVLHRPKASDA